MVKSKRKRFKGLRDTVIACDDDPCVMNQVSLNQPVSVPPPMPCDIKMNLLKLHNVLTALLASTHPWTCLHKTLFLYWL